ncbi:MAG: hypothetical protein ACQETO_04935 [Pseudomonadota bacterium]
MNQPDQDFRSFVAEQSRALREMTDDAAESGLDELLAVVLEQLQGAIQENPPESREGEPDAIAASCHAWASLVSHAVASVYAPNSPFPRNVAGWGNRAVVRLNQISSVLRTPLDVAKRLLGADSYSISVGFPWGVSVGLSWQ